jgi:hypothetical protein
MPVVDVDPDELRELVGTEKDDDELREDMFSLGLEFEGWTEDDEFQLEFAPDRLDRLSVEGIARSLRYHYGMDRGVYIPNTNEPAHPATMTTNDHPAGSINVIFELRSDGLSRIDRFARISMRQDPRNPIIGGSSADSHDEAIRFQYGTVI